MVMVVVVYLVSIKGQLDFASMDLKVLKKNILDGASLLPAAAELERLEVEELVY